MQARIAGYRARRGWLAWHVAALSRGDFGTQFPALEDVIGNDAAVGSRGMSEAQIAHSAVLWIAHLKQGE